MVPEMMEKAVTRVLFIKMLSEPIFMVRCFRRIHRFVIIRLQKALEKENTAKQISSLDDVEEIQANEYIVKKDLSSGII